MAAYPSTPLMHPSSSIVPRRTIAMTDAEDGTIRGASVHTVESYDVNIIHRRITKAQKDTLESFYGTNKLNQVEVTWDGSTYNCRLLGKPEATYEDNGGLYWGIHFRMLGNKVGGA